ncbi:HIT domain-containing protein [bacterium]|nr:MAG: HIT domain-containing protein [bacterium]
MDRVWAPWRINYVRSKKNEKGCIFCRATRLVNRGLASGCQSHGLANRGKDYVIFKTRLCIAMLNIYPYNNGHILISPLRHIRDISQLKEEEMLDLFKCLNQAKKLLQKVLKPQGYNIGLNLTRVAGAGITGHLHLHIVPRWVGDTNFMPATCDTKIISQSLDELLKRLKNANR